MQRQHRALAEADQLQRRRRQLAARELGIEEFVEAGTRGVHAGPALVRVAEGQVEPLLAAAALAAGFGCMRGNEGGLRQQWLPGAADLDQVVAVGAIAMQENHELPGRTALRLDARTVEFCRHYFETLLLG